MLSSNDIRNVKFSKSVGGYKQEEVDVLLDKIENDYEQHERTIRELTDKIESLNNQIDGFKETQGSIQNVLLSAQRLADQIVEEAKVKSEEIIKNAEANISIITAREKELSNAFELKASERKAAVEAEINAMLTEAKKKSEAIEKETEETVNRQQMLFDRFKVEILNFKTEITKKYKEHLEALHKLPDAAGMDPARIAEVISTNFVEDDSNDIILDNKTTVNDDYQEPISDETYDEKPTSNNNLGFFVDTNKFN